MDLGWFKVVLGGSSVVLDPQGAFGPVEGPPGPPGQVQDLQDRSRSSRSITRTSRRSSRTTFRRILVGFSWLKEGSKELLLNGAPFEKSVPEY